MRLRIFFNRSTRSSRTIISGATLCRLIASKTLKSENLNGFVPEAYISTASSGPFFSTSFVLLLDLLTDLMHLKHQIISQKVKVLKNKRDDLNTIFISRHWLKLTLPSYFFSILMKKPSSLLDWRKPGSYEIPTVSW